MGFVTAEDGARLFYRDWGPCGGRPVVLGHGWPRNADQWEVPARFLAGHGFRVFSYDRRGHGRSDQTWDGNDLDTYADDLATVVERLELTGATLIGAGTGAADVTRYLSRHGTGRVDRVAFVAAAVPFGVPAAVAAPLLAASLTDRAQLYADLAAGSYFGVAPVPLGVREALRWQALQAGLHNAHAALAACVGIDLRGELAADAPGSAALPTLVVHGGADAVVPPAVGGEAIADAVPGARLRIYPGAPHGLVETHREQLHDDLLTFLQS